MESIISTYFLTSFLLLSSSSNSFNVYFLLSLLIWVQLKEKKQFFLLCLTLSDFFLSFYEKSFEKMNKKEKRKFFLILVQANMTYYFLERCEIHQFKLKDSLIIKKTNLHDLNKWIYSILFNYSFIKYIVYSNN